MPSSAVGQPCRCRFCKANSSKQASSDKPLKPTVAELPASECAKAMLLSGKRVDDGCCAQSFKSLISRHDHSSASFK